MITKVYVITILNSDGFYDGGEVRCIVDTDKNSLFETAYNRYTNIFKANEDYLVTDGREEPENYEAFCNDLDVGLSVWIQCDTYHITFELHEKNLFIDEDEV